ncbi:hypothetical protein D9M72_532160 [compost metagenome]
MLPAVAPGQQVGLGPGQRRCLLADGVVERVEEAREVLPAARGHALRRHGLHAGAVLVAVLRQLVQLLLRLRAQALQPAEFARGGVGIVLGEVRQGIKR